MRVAFMGTPDFAVHFLDLLLDSHHEVVGVVTQPDRPKGRGRKLDSPPVKKAAEAKGLPILQPESLKDEVFQEELKKWDADLFVVVAYSILPKSVLAIPKIGSVNMHGSLLPKYRGAAPVQWAVANGDKESGVTIFLLDEKMDHGPVIEIAKCPIDEEDTAEDLFNNLIPVGCEAMKRALEKIESGDYQPLEQNHEEATPARKLKKEDGKIHWDSQSADAIYNRVRGFFPYPICYTQMGEKVLRIHKTRKITEGKSLRGVPGQVTFDESKRMFVECKDGFLEIIKLQIQGKSVLEPKEFFNGLSKEQRVSFVLGS